VIVIFDKINKEIKNFIKYSINEDKKEKKDDEEEYVPKCRC
jgi:hypothetical protein